MGQFSSRITTLEEENAALRTQRDTAFDVNDKLTAILDKFVAIHEVLMGENASLSTENTDLSEENLCLKRQTPSSCGKPSHIMTIDLKAIQTSVSKYITRLDQLHSVLQLSSDKADAHVKLSIENLFDLLGVALPRFDEQIITVKEHIRVHSDMHELQMQTFKAFGKHNFEELAAVSVAINKLMVGIVLSSDSVEQQASQSYNKRFALYGQEQEPLIKLYGCSIGDQRKSADAGAELSTDAEARSNSDDTPEVLSKVRME